jgi:Phospholipase B
MRNSGVDLLPVLLVLCFVGPGAGAQDGSRKNAGKGDVAAVFSAASCAAGRATEIFRSDSNAELSRCGPAVDAFRKLHARAAGGNKHKEDNKERLRLAFQRLVGACGPKGKSLPLAVAHYEVQLNQTGWDMLRVVQNPSSSGSESAVTDADRAYCSGFVEGQATYRALGSWWAIFVQEELGGSRIDPKSELGVYLTKQLEFLRTNAEKNPTGSSFWRQISNTLAQLDGLRDGYNGACADSSSSPCVSGNLTELDFYGLTASGDLETLLGLYKHTADEAAHARARSRVLSSVSWNAQQLDCSGFVKFERSHTHQPLLYTGHSTWTHYFSMYRMWKVYMTAFQEDAGIASQHVSFSSRPGYLDSKDDFYSMPDSQLVTLETTNSVSNRTLFHLYVTPESVLTWMRVIVANRLGADGQEWTQYFSTLNSGTYNNQWMCVDYSRTDVGDTGLLWVAEQVPGFVEAADLTAHLERETYWPSYNVPFFKKIYDVSGYPGVAAANGKGPAYLSAPRAKIFGRNQTDVTDLESMKLMMRYNDWQHDPFSLGLAGNAVASRFDLGGPAAKQQAFGAIDSKVVGVEDVTRSGHVHAISGPTCVQQPVFAWTPQFNHTYHVGLPEKYDFAWIVAH